MINRSSQWKSSQYLMQEYGFLTMNSRSSQVPLKRFQEISQKKKKKNQRKSKSKKKDLLRASAASAASLTLLTWRDLRSASLNTATVLMLSFCAVSMTLQAISPRLAIRILSNRGFSFCVVEQWATWLKGKRETRCKLKGTWRAT